MLIIVTHLKYYSRYLAQNAAIWLAVEVLRYRDHDISRCQDDISWHLFTQQSKGRNANNGSSIVARNGESTHIYYERVNFIACFRINCWFLQTLNYRGNEKEMTIHISNVFRSFRSNLYRKKRVCNVIRMLLFFIGTPAGKPLISLGAQPGATAVCLIIVFTQAAKMADQWLAEIICIQSRIPSTYQ